MVHWWNSLHLPPLPEAPPWQPPWTPIYTPTFSPTTNTSRIMLQSSKQSGTLRWTCRNNIGYFWHAKPSHPATNLPSNSTFWNQTSIESHEPKPYQAALIRPQLRCAEVSVVLSKHTQYWASLQITTADHQRPPNEIKVKWKKRKKKKKMVQLLP